MKMRLQKYLSMNGIASRRQCETEIAAGHVSVNGNVITEMGYQIDSDTDRVTYRGKNVLPSQQKSTILLHKPIGVVSTVKDQFGRTTVIDLVKVSERLYPVGRLDYLTSGLLLLTSDGDVALRLTHPRYQTKKVYHAWLQGVITEDAMHQFRSGVSIEEYVTAPAEINILKKKPNKCQVEIVLREGKNRQVRKMCDFLGYPVSQLKRVGVGSLTLGDLKPGEWRYLSVKEVNQLMNPDQS
ncbi:pseudouridine synthase [Anoxynatronum buryatiense]|uniref:Pseudouridine synthase n=1 Tax=Anoxynatronum buryatiense TaxID=489973 RepID=A0AA45WUG8_9CLOT|nr:pseudouridine synthase [Anoxynatronum buryatiense]SMP47860.1 ribosomal large subunit pseudouridine synthase B [Anoxynatronum buryatiense]